jgi:predicted Rossmann fold flavoprotein
MVQTMYDLIVMGAGPAGIMSAISAKKHNPKLSVLILESNDKVGKKLLVSGAGRCNISNNNLSVSCFHGGDSRFVSSVFKRFNSKSIIDFFDDLGIDFYEEQKNGRTYGKLFPVTNRADTVVRLLELELEHLGVEVELNKTVKDVKKEDEGFRIITGEEEIFKSNKIVIATGGMSYPSLGSTGIGFEIAKRFGHDVVKPVPSALGVVAKHWILPRIAGYKCEIEVFLNIKSKFKTKATDEVIFTDYGVSGNAIFALSRDISIRLNREEKNEVELVLNFFPGCKSETLLDKLNQRWRKRPGQIGVSCLYGLLPNKISDNVFRYLKIDLERKSFELSTVERRRICEFLCKFPLQVKSTKSWQEAEFTAGGVATHEIKIENLESKIVPGLHFVGEVLDVDGDIGGYNLAWAWATGWIVGKGVE